ncbi:uncharacterized protein LOC128987104 [Macrosteles quadrilineatus]|uniref:uncharacterized protein LOC128987104 n=1 Tax=Macrosteles quadrilineatus TaxID=74068 RepID=UPI0023E2E1D0|nr:uncharacterized protein LOC128987104 [Macrosteles quadrilineatus]
MFQALNKSGYYISSKKKEKIDSEDDITKESMKIGNGEKHCELKLWIKDLITVQKWEDEFYCYHGIKINIVDIYGVIVAVQSNNYGVSYTVDDGTGEIDCWYDNRRRATTEKLFKLMETTELSVIESTNQDTSTVPSIFMETSTSYICENKPEAEQWLKTQILKELDKPPFGQGNTIQIRGKLADFRGSRCIRIYNIRHVTNIDEETDRRFELIHLYQTIYHT